MPNFIERTLADAVNKVREDAANKVTDAANKVKADAANKVREDAANKVKADAAREERARKALVEEKGKRVFEETGISETLGVIAANIGGKITKYGAYMTKDYMKKDEPYHAEMVIFLTKDDGHEVSSVTALYREDGSVVIGSEAGNELIGSGNVLFPKHRMRVQILTPQQLQNNDVVAAALEKAVNKPYKTKSSPPEPPRNLGY